MRDTANYFLDQLFRDQEPYLFTFADVLLAMTVSMLLAYVFVLVYRSTHRGTSYSQSFIHTVFIMAVATSIIMMIIGSNIARAFSLVGALSIIRFRTAVKDARDTGFLFAAMVAGMGCGTQFYMPAIAFTFFISALILVLHIYEFGKKEKLDNIVRITFKKGDETVEEIDKSIQGTFKSPRLLNRLLDFDEKHATNIYAVRSVSSQDVENFESHMQKVPGVLKVAVFQRDQFEGE